MIISKRIRSTSQQGFLTFCSEDGAAVITELAKRLVLQEWMQNVCFHQEHKVRMLRKTSINSSHLPKSS